VTNRKLNLFFFLLSLIPDLLCHAKAIDQFKHPFYIGAIGGVGSTTWEGLVPSQKNKNLAISMSTPTHVKEGGYLWGMVVGYEFIPYFALEANYMRYPSANVSFDLLSLFSFNNNELTAFETNTETLSLMGKIMLIIPNTPVRVYSSAGVSNVHRQDMIIDDWRLSPTFGVGFNYHFTDHFMGELGGNYTAGYGESQLNPSDTYFPFLYSISVRLAYCF
jgi:hypothetical protein